jgi:hypothetical protein
MKPCPTIALSASGKHFALLSGRFCPLLRSVLLIASLMLATAASEVHSQSGENHPAAAPLHGVTVSGGAKVAGVLFSFDPSKGPSGFNVDHSFCPSPGCYDGYAPMGSLAVLSDGYRVICGASAGERHGHWTVWVWDSSSRTFDSVSLTSVSTGRTPLVCKQLVVWRGAFGKTFRGLTSYCNQHQDCRAPFYFDPNAMTVRPYPAFPNSIPSPYAQYAELQTPYVLPGDHILLPRFAVSSAVFKLVPRLTMPHTAQYGRTRTRTWTRWLSDV